MVDDSEELERERSYQPRKSFFSGRLLEKPPPGRHVVTALSAGYAVLLWGVTLALAVLLSGDAGATSSGVVSPGTCILLVVMGAEMFVGGALAEKTWLALGPSVRTVLRPFGTLGPTPVFVIGGLVLFAVFLVATGKISLAELTRKPAGENWVLVVRAGEVKWPVAQQICSSLGADWKVPSREDWDACRPPFVGETGQYYWTALPSEPPQGSLSRMPCPHRHCRLVHDDSPVEPTQSARLVCFKR